MQIDHSFIEEQVEEEYSFADKPQLLTLSRSDGGLDVVVYFMMNTALTITGSKVTSALGVTKLKVLFSSPDDVMCASMQIHKVRYRFTNPAGMITDFTFTS